MVGATSRRKAYDMALSISDLPTTQFTAGAIVKAGHAATIPEAHELLAPFVDRGDLTKKTASSGAVNYKLVKNARNAKKAGTATKTAAPKTETTDDFEAAYKAYLTADSATRQKVYDDAKPESKALKQWEKDGKGRRPKTPNLDLIIRESADRAAGIKPKRASKKAGTRSGAPRGTTVQFVVDGREMPSSQNKLSSVAWYHTKGVGGDDVARISSTELRDLIVAEGIVDPANTPGWKVTLPNGKVVEAKRL
jgi:hypothetical protein